MAPNRSTTTTHPKSVSTTEAPPATVALDRIDRAHVNMETTAPPKTTYSVHPAATTIPEPSAVDYARLKEDIRAHGLKVPIMLTPDGQILDGRTRARIIDELLAEGAKPRRVVSRVATTEEMLDPVALVLSLNAARRHLKPDQIAALYLTQQTAPGDRASREALTPAGQRGPRGKGKTAEKIAKKIGVSRATVERVQEIQKKAPESLAKVAAGKVSAKKTLKGIHKDLIHGRREPDGTPVVVEGEGQKMFLLRIEGFMGTSKHFVRAIKDVQATREPVAPEEYDKAFKAIDKIREALDLVAPRWQCTTCNRVLDPDTDFEDEPPTRYECGECGEKSRENRCEQCNKFSPKESDSACIDENCEGEMELVSWETVADQLAKQEKEAEAKEAAQEKKRKDEEAFEKTPAGKKAAAEEAGEEAREAAENLTETEDKILERAVVITRARAEGKTVKEVEREIKRANDVGVVIERYLEQEARGGIGTYWLDKIKGFNKAEQARFEAAKNAAKNAKTTAVAVRP